MTTTELEAVTTSANDGHVWCRFAAPGRGDCEHFIGLPAVLDETTCDEYGIPHGWCEYCWASHQLSEARATVRRLEAERDHLQGAAQITSDAEDAWTWFRNTTHGKAERSSFMAGYSAHSLAAESVLARSAGPLREAAQQALDHVEELRDAWQRGVISEHDGQGGTRSNRNVDVAVALRKALAAPPADEVGQK